MNLYEDLKWRGLIKDVTSPELEEKLNNGGMTFYIGADPTAESLHIGQFPTFLVAERLRRRSKRNWRKRKSRYSSYRKKLC